MRKIHFALIFITLFTAHAAFADMDSAAYSESKPCKAIAQACATAGFSNNKKFWFDCMKPVILGKTVKGVNIDPNTAKSCRIDKIAKLKKQLQEFMSVSS